MTSTYQFDVAISFAEEDRNAALALAYAMEKDGLSTYYYPDNMAEALGGNLEEQLTDIYLNRAKYAIVLLSQHYFHESKIFTKIELAAIQSRMQTEADIVYMVPVKLSKDISLESHPFIERLAFLEWNYKPDEISKLIREKLGKKIERPDGNGKVVNADTIVGPVNIIDTNSGTLIIDQSDTDIIYDFGSPKETRFVCPHCDEELEHQKYGKNICEKCSKVFFIPSPIETRVYKTLRKEEGWDYNKILAHISNKLREKKYSEAYEYCLKAEELAPAESTTWAWFALTEFLLEINRERANRKTSIEIIKSIRLHTEKCKDHGITDERYEELVVDIANRLFYLERSRIRSVHPALTDAKGIERWSRQNLYFIQPLLRSFEVCYGLYKDILFLEEYVRELCKPYKWLGKTIDGDIVSIHTWGGFNPYEKFKTLVSKIKEVNPDYAPPEISEQRFVIISDEEIQDTSEHQSSDMSTN